MLQMEELFNAILLGTLVVWILVHGSDTLHTFFEVVFVAGALGGTGTFFLQLRLQIDRLFFLLLFFLFLFLFLISAFLSTIFFLLSFLSLVTAFFLRVRVLLLVVGGCVGVSFSEP